jgi:hypothetical protein
MFWAEKTASQDSIIPAPGQDPGRKMQRPGPFNNLVPGDRRLIIILALNSIDMKKLLAIVLLVPLFSIGQDSCKLIRETDPYTKQTKLSTGFIYFDGGSLTIDADSKEIDFLFSIEGADKCFDNSSVAAIFFEGVKTKMNSRNGGSMNCEGLFHFIFKNSPATTSLLQKLISQKIHHIVFTGNNKKESTINIGPVEQETLRTLAACLVNEAKTLIK